MRRPQSPCMELPAAGRRCQRRAGRDGALVLVVRHDLLTLLDDTVVRTGHGNSTRIGAESRHLEEWIAHGHAGQRDTLPLG